MEMPSSHPAPLWQVGLLGGFGGFVSWLLAYKTDLEASSLRWQTGVIPILMGAIVAVAAVEIFPKLDLKNPRACRVFALVYGLFWTPVFAILGSFIGVSRPDRQALILSRQVTGVASRIHTAPPKALPTRLSSATDSTLNLLALLPAIEAPGIRAQATASTEVAISAIGNSANWLPSNQKPLTAAALREIGLASLSMDQAAPVRASADSLVGLAHDDPKLKRVAQRAIETFAERAEARGRPALAAEMKWKAAEVQAPR